MSKRFYDLQKEILEQRIVKLKKEYLAANAQRDRSLSDVDRIRLDGEIEYLRRQLEEASAELDEMEPNSPGDPRGPTSPDPAPVSRQNRLPAQSTRFLNREDETTEVEKLLLSDDVRLLTITGGPGMGKTRVAVQVVNKLGGMFEDGFYFVGTATVKDQTLLVQAITKALGIRKVQGIELLDSLKEFLHNKHVLLIIDRFEHLVDTSSILKELLDEAPRLKILVTSRKALYEIGEHLCEVGALTAPKIKQLPLSEGVSQYVAVQLFRQQASAVKRDFEINNENASAIAEICARLEGLPLAIELAAVKVRELTPHMILARLRESPWFLAEASRDAPNWQQTLEGTIEWSYSLLKSDDQKLLRRLAVFEGGWTFEAAQAICNPREDLGKDVARRLGILIRNSLIRAEEQEGGEMRYNMLHPIILEYAEERLKENGEIDDLRRRHMNFFLQLAERAEPLHRGSGRVKATQQLEDDYDNLRVALLGAIQSEDAEVALRLGGALFWFWNQGGYWSEARELLRAALALPGAARQDRARAQALYAIGGLSWLYGYHAEARAYLDESIELWRALGAEGKSGLAYALDIRGGIKLETNELDAARKDREESEEIFRAMEGKEKWGHALALLDLGDVISRQGDLKTAERLFNESLKLFEETGDKWGISHALGYLGNLHYYRDHDIDKARPQFEKALANLRTLHDQGALNIALLSLIDLRRYVGEYEQAKKLNDESVELSERLGNKGVLAWAIHNQAYIALHERNYRRAVELFNQAQILFRERNEWKGIAECIVGLARVVLTAELQGRNESEQGETGTRLLGAVDAVYGGSIVQSPLSPADYRVYVESVNAAKGLLGESRFQEVMKAGQEMTRDEALSLVSVVSADWIAA